MPANIGKNYLEKTVEELRASKERCFEKSLGYVKKIKTSFANVGAYSNEDNFIRGDPEGVIEWISGEAEAFEEILSDRGDVCAFSGARGVSAILEKAGCNHVKTLAQAEAAFSVDDTKDPSAKASLMGGKFFTDIWENGGREMAHEILKKSEKDIHDAREAAVGAKAKTSPFARCLRRPRCTNGDKTTGRLTLRPTRRQTKACDEVVSSCDLVQHGGPRVIRPIVTGPAWPLRITGLICKCLPVITVYNPALWEYSGDNLGA
jgi:hypothetical protein